LTLLYPKYDGLATNRPVMGVTQTSLALVLRFGLCTEEEREKTAAHLARLIRDNGTHLTTGFLGTGNLLWALAENGEKATALDLLFQESYPSWLFSVNHGATTMWEHWDGMKEDGTLWPEKMNSFNHYAYGAVYDFIFGACAGIQNADGTAGYKELCICPTVDKRFGDHLFASLKTENGLLSSAYYFEENRVRYEFEIPKNTKARIVLSDGERIVGEGKYIYFV
jgi:alpha-L-rhamnosidase